MRRLSVLAIITSPWFFLVFLVFPLALIAQLLLGKPLMEPRIILFNVVLFICYLFFLISLRFLNGKRAMKYGNAKSLLRTIAQNPLPGSAIQEHLKTYGYVFNHDGRYGEAPDRGYHWGTLFLVGVIVTLGTGSYDNLRQLSGTLRLGIGEPAKLYQRNMYVHLVAGPFAGLDSVPYQLQIRKQYRVSEQWPDGGADVAILDRDGKELLQGTVAPDKPLLFGSFRLFTAGFVYEPWVVVVTSKEHFVYGGWIKLRQDRSAQDAYRFSGTFSDESMKVSGRARYDPDNDFLQFEASKNGERIVDVVLGMGELHKKENRGYITTLLGIGKWTEIHFVRKRHPLFLILGAGLAIVGGIFRLIHRPRRVWIEERDEGCTIKTTDWNAARSLRTLSGA